MAGLLVVVYAAVELMVVAAVNSLPIESGDIITARRQRQQQPCVGDTGKGCSSVRVASESVGLLRRRRRRAVDDWAATSDNWASRRRLDDVDR